MLLARRVLKTVKSGTTHVHWQVTHSQQWQPPGNGAFIGYSPFACGTQKWYLAVGLLGAVARRVGPTVGILWLIRLGISSGAESSRFFSRVWLYHDVRHNCTPFDSYETDGP